MIQEIGVCNGVTVGGGGGGGFYLERKLYSVLSLAMCKISC